MQPATFIACFLLPFCAGLSAQTVNWPLDTPPAGANPAASAVARNDWMQKFQANLDRTRKGGVELLFVGDSITESWKYATGGLPVFEREYGTTRAASFGVAGDRTENILWRLENGELDGIDPKLIVVLAGTNNVRHTEVEIAGGIQTIVETCQRRCPSAHVLVLAIFPRGDSPTDRLRVKMNDVNRLIAPLGDGRRVTFLDIGNVFLREDGTLRRDLMPDALHPNRAGYEAWARAIRPVVRKHLTDVAN